MRFKTGRQFWYLQLFEKKTWSNKIIACESIHLLCFCSALALENIFFSLGPASLRARASLSVALQSCSLLCGLFPRGFLNVAIHQPGCFNDNGPFAPKNRQKRKMFCFRSFRFQRDQIGKGSQTYNISMARAKEQKGSACVLTYVPSAISLSQGLMLHHRGLHAWLASERIVERH